MKSQLRRYTKLGNLPADDGENVYQVGGLLVNDDLKEVSVEGEPVKLTPIEYNILLLLVKNPGKVFSIEQIYESIWNEEAIGADNTVAVHIRHIREKIEINPKEPRYLKVVLPKCLSSPCFFTISSQFSSFIGHLHIVHFVNYMELYNKFK